jgi:hypothetical protein
VSCTYLIQITDSDDLECYVYRDKPNNNTPSYTIPPWSYNNSSEIESSPYYYDKHYYSSTGTETDGCESAAAYNKEEFSARRPVLRSTVSEIPHSSAFRHQQQKKFSSKPFSKHHTSINYYTNPSEDEEFTPLVRSRPLRRRKGTSSHGSHTGKR